MSERAAEKLVSHFVEVRSKLKDVKKDETSARTGVPITVRQLEAIVRISESLAKMTLSPIATEEHVEEAVRLFNISTLNALQSGPGGENVARPQFQKDVENIQAQILRRLPKGSQISQSSLINNLENQGFSRSAVERAIYMFIRKEVLRYKDRQMTITRVG